MTGKIFRYSFLVSALALFLCVVLFYGLEYRRTYDESLLSLQKETDIVSKGITLGGMDYLKALENRTQVIWFAPDGSVLYQSSTEQFADKDVSSEVLKAIKQGSGQLVTSSTTDDNRTQLLYSAKRLPDGTALCLISSVDAAQQAMTTVFPVFWIFLLVLTVSSLFALRAAKQILRPINELDLDYPERSKVYAELSPLVARLQEQRYTIQNQIEELNKRQKEFTTLTDNMTEGFLLLDSQGTVISANASARILIPDTAPGEMLLSYADALTAGAAKQALNGERGEALITKDDRSWQVVASPVRTDERIAGAVLLLLDVTEREQRELLRREFSANVSHELKTPLTSISGFAELMETGTVPPEKVVEFSGDIRRQSQRLLEMIQDIIMLSKLDEASQIFELEPVDIRELAEDVLDSLRITAEKNGVHLSLQGEPIQIKGVWRLLNEMLYNLCDNAIKYNRPGGNVTVTTGRVDHAPFLQVSDNGIGIPEQEQGRIFERFYRVDKSHSKQIEGTGLGLSIVKHAAQFHHAKLILESKQELGTTVKLVFPKEA